MLRSFLNNYYCTIFFYYYYYYYKIDFGLYFNYNPFPDKGLSYFYSSGSFFFKGLIDYYKNYSLDPEFIGDLDIVNLKIP